MPITMPTSAVLDAAAALTSTTENADGKKGWRKAGHRRSATLW